MIFLSIKKLEKQLAEGQLTEKDGLHYLISWAILLSLIVLFPKESSYSNLWFDFADLLFSLLITIFGIKYIFRIHAKNWKDQFLKNFISLAFVHFWRLVIVLAIIMLLGKIILYFIPLDYFLWIDGLLKEDFTNLLFSITLELIYYFLLTNSFKRICDLNVALS